VNEYNGNMDIPVFLNNQKRRSSDN